MKIPGYYYVKCTSIGPGLFDSQRTITVYEEKGDSLLVSALSLAKSKSGEILAKFYAQELKDKKVYGFLENNENGWPSGRRTIPLKSLVDETETFSFEEIPNFRDN